MLKAQAEKHAKYHAKYYFMLDVDEENEGPPYIEKPHRTPGRRPQEYAELGEPTHILICWNPILHLVSASLMCVCVCVCVCVL